jgi:hypothetical protein
MKIKIVPYRMGSGYSLPSTLTREKVFELTRSTRATMDVILDYMIKEITVRDFLALSNPTECKKYVIFMANTLHNLFYELQIAPIKDKRGVLAFRPIKELVNPPAELATERQSLCLTISYFYTRIFQIYGALALTLIDDSKLMMDSGMASFYEDRSKRFLQPPGYRPYITAGGTIMPTTLGNFNFLRTYLRDERDSSKGFLTKYSGDAEGKGIIYFLPREKVEQETQKEQTIVSSGKPLATTSVKPLATPIDTTQKGIFYIGYSGGKRYAQLEVFAKIDEKNRNITFNIGKLKYYKKSDLSASIIDIPVDVVMEKSITIQRKISYGTTAYVYLINDIDLTINEYFDDVFNRIIQYLKKTLTDEKLQELSNKCNSINNTCKGDGSGLTGGSLIDMFLCEFLKSELHEYVDFHNGESDMKICDIPLSQKKINGKSAIALDWSKNNLNGKIKNYFTNHILILNLLIQLTKQIKIKKHIT